MVKTVKMGLKACSQQKEKIEVFLPRLLFIPQKSEKVWYKKNKESNLERAEFIMQKGHGTATINREKGNSILAHADQISPQGEYEEQNEEEIPTIPSVDDLLKQPLQNEASEDEIIRWVRKLG